MSSKLHVCLFQTIGAEVIEPVLWSSLDSRIRVICYAYYSYRYSRRQYLFMSSWSYPTLGRQIFHITIRAGWLPILLHYVVTIGALIHAGRGLRGQLLCALRYLSMAHQLSASNVGGDTRDDSAKNNLYLESQNHSFASIMGLFVRSSQK